MYDRDAYGRSQLPNNAFEFTLDELASHPEYLAFINDPTNSRLEKEKTVSIKAGELIGKLYDKLREGYIDPDSEESMHALNVLCVRLVFCLYCEDAGLFGKDAFYNYLKDVPANRIRTTLKNLFHALDTNLSERDPYDLEVKAFPYVNGGLFRDESEVPNFTDETKSFLLDEVSSHIDWSQISPTIFGGIFESTLNPETRRSGGMHYTSPENIHKVIDPLFLDDLKEELKSICTEEGTTPRKRENALKHFHEKICSLTFFDPACGSGNFLTETYICLRKLEDTVLNELRKGQTGLSLGDEEEAGKRVSLNQFYGIEINDFAVTVAETALWISRLKANGETSMFYDAGGDDFPLSEKAHIVEGNALRIDWNRVLSASECNYIMGNPPFVGYSNHSAEQQKDRASLFGKVKTVDYVACWYKKAADYISNFPIHCAFVSTNSICQGQQVQPIWEPLFQSGIHIDFAWQTFIWSSEAALQAHVYVVIVGFSRFGNEKRILFLKDGQKRTVENINGYLQNGSEIFIEKRNKPLCSVPLMIAGGKPTDGGNLILSLDEKSELVLQEPSAAKWIRPYSMGDEFINKKERFCLWLVGISLSELENLTLVQKRVESVRNMRLMSSKIATQKKALTPWLFDEVKPPKSNFIGIPAVTSSRRKYVPFDFVTNGMIPGNQLYFVETESLYYFGILVSQFHNAWIRIVAGRLGDGYRYSNTIVYNNFVWPEETVEQKKIIERTARNILNVRSSYTDKSLADLYDPDKMPADLLAAHKANDAAVEAAYGVDFDGDEEKIVAHLFKLYAEKTKEK